MGKKNYSWQLEASSYFGWTPSPKRWFEFIGWITALSTLNFFAEITQSLYVNVIYYASYGVLFNYVQKTLWTQKYQSYLPDRLSKQHKINVTYLFSVVIVALSYMFILRISDDIEAGLHLQLPLP